MTAGNLSVAERAANRELDLLRAIITREGTRNRTQFGQQQLDAAWVGGGSDISFPQVFGGMVAQVFQGFLKRGELGGGEADGNLFFFVDLYGLAGELEHDRTGFQAGDEPTAAFAPHPGRCANR